MFRYKFLLAIIICSMVYSGQRSTLDNETIISLMQQRRKASKELQAYVKLLEFHHRQTYSDPYKDELAQLHLEAVKLLSYNKKLSHLSMDYHCKGCQKSLEEIYVIVDKMSSLDSVTERISRFLIDLDTASSNKDMSKQFPCEASKKICSLQKKASSCLEQKNHDCYRVFFDEIIKEGTNYNKCIDLMLLEKGFLS